MDIRSDRDRLLAEAKSVVQKAKDSGRDLTTEEQRTVDESLSEVKRINEKLKAEAQSKHILGQLDDMARQAHSGSGRPTPGCEVSPLTFDTEHLKALHAAVKHRATYQVQAKAFSTAVSHLPAQLSSTIIGPQYEDRLLNYLPAQPIIAPSWEYVRHTSTTGAPAVVAEGAPKPELTLVTDNVITTAVKVAAHIGLSQESLDDWDVFATYVQTELIRAIIDAENEQLLNGDGVGNNITGLLATSGILTRAKGTDTALDAVEQGIADLRVNAALATANLLILHPATWSSIRRSKDSQQRYLTQADPTVGEANTAWGVPVLSTTVMPAGTGLLLDTTKMGRVLVRSPLTVRTGTAGSDFTSNIVRFVCETRLALAVERPPAVLKLTGL